MFVLLCIRTESKLCQVSHAMSETDLSSRSLKQHNDADVLKKPCPLNYAESASCNRLCQPDRL